MLNLDWYFIIKSFHSSKSNETHLKKQKFNKSKRFSFKIKGRTEKFELSSIFTKIPVFIAKSQEFILDKHWDFHLKCKEKNFSV
jgi:hypothetical protein